MSFAFVVTLSFLAINVKRLRNNNTQICWKHESTSSQDYVKSNQRGLSIVYSFSDTDMVGRSRGDEDFSNQDSTNAIPHVGCSFATESMYAEIHKATDKANTGGLRNGTGLNQPTNLIKHTDMYAEINTDLPATSNKSTDAVVPIYAKVNKKK
ncbi:uncharacterized protein LOC117112504 [Anneissia japonica]|uniref:uncharacterized protein LOC117112504 n=1 Tax=Anneissia japonica TaxID=1529436 RepID=UPI0014254F2B|nr:uncharacterized protein LOC117112504 [Anneissia japonica]